MTGPHLAGRSWSDFQYNPLPSVHADHLAQCLSPVQIQDETALRQALENEGTRALFLPFLRDAYALKPLSFVKPAQSTRAMAALDVQQWATAARACGLIFWAPVLARELRASVVRHLTQQLGADWWSWVEWGAAKERKGSRSLHRDHWPDTAQAWVPCIQQTGFTLLDTWTTSLDEELAAWVRLKSPVPPAGPAEPGEDDGTLAMTLVDSVSQQLRQAL